MAALASSALWLTGCASDGNVATFTAGDTRLAVNLPAVCEGFLQAVPAPAVTRKTDARVAVVRYAGALQEANFRLVSGRDCERDLRTGYMGKGKTK